MRYPFNIYGLKDIIWWFKYRLLSWHKYHILKTGLKPSYYCFDTVIVPAMMIRFSSEYVHTRDFIVIDPPIKQKLDYAYLWWNTLRPIYVRKLEEIEKEYHKRLFKAYPHYNLRVEASEEDRRLLDEIKDIQTEYENYVNGVDERVMIDIIQNRWDVSW